MTDLLLAFGYCSLSGLSAGAIIVGSWIVCAAALIGGILLTWEILRGRGARGR